ncbi:hypothetical protein CH375_02130 [Leptospira ellisii]|nr:hypothetical protein CH375_02130 [Leptospira ellisii]
MFLCGVGTPSEDRFHGGFPFPSAWELTRFTLKRAFPLHSFAKILLQIPIRSDECPNFDYGADKNKQKERNAHKGE